MQDMPENNVPDQQQAERIREAEAKVAAMFESARSQNKRSDKKRRTFHEDSAPVLPFVPPVKQESIKPAKTEVHEASDIAKEHLSGLADDILPADTDKETAEPADSVSEAETRVEAMLANARTQSKKPSVLSRELFVPKAEQNKPAQETSDDRIDAMFADARLQGSMKDDNSATYLATEVVILEFVSLFLFFMAMKSEMPGFSLIAVLLPIIAGILYRMFAKQLTLREAVSKCKLHIFISVFNFVCAMLSM
ncbi:hypothetical protein [Ruminococcus sp.]|uniref:hypothetical protein n=1 Tax=Ruminococcus sp. TaxID=41978 RepID=UPI002C18FD46|nr:hypothetical protein [Ruminococcus sp.]HNZ98524.1 hypothetical protein [Ruminococcus sp.]HOH88295.1 hypothetical protein [Ruminococcus sp.]